MNVGRLITSTCRRGKVKSSNLLSLNLQQQSPITASPRHVETQLMDLGASRTNLSTYPGDDKASGDSDHKNEEKEDTSSSLFNSASSCVKTVSVVPGKGPPPEPPVECCMTGCPNCVWLKYAEELKEYYSDGGEAAREAIEKIDNYSLKVFLKLELDL